jgi:hypothetical protein
MQRAFVQSNFSGGKATDSKLGIKYSFADSQSIDFRKKPSQFSILPQPRAEDTAIINDLVQNMVMVNSGIIYALGNTGSFYKRTTAGVWSLVSSFGTGTFGLDYRKDSDAIYACGQKSVSLYSSVSGSPVSNPNFYGTSLSTYDNSDTAGFNVSSYQDTGTASTTLASSFTESDPKRYFQTDIEPLQQMQVFVNSKGTGDWTLTLHDGLNTVLGTTTVATADIASNAWLSIPFPTVTNQQVRLYVKPNARTYHFHLTSSNGTGTVASLATNDLSGCNLQMYADRLVQTTNGMHPLVRFQQYECFGNGNYLSTWEPITDPPTNDEWQRHRLVFPQEYEVCGIAAFNEYLAIACERTTTGSQTPQEGIVFFWDGLSPTYNYLTKIPEGSPYAIHEYKNILYYYAGGSWYAINSPASQPVKIRTMPDTDTEYSGTTPSVTVYPYAATVRSGIHMMAFPSRTDNTIMRYGVYSWGAIDKNFPESFGYSYPISTGSQLYTAQNNLTIGMVRSYGSQMWTSWRDDDNGGYGIDVVDNTSVPATSAFWESLIFDNGFVGKQKTAAYIQTTFAELPADSTFMLKYSINRADWVYSDTMLASTLTETNVARFDINREGSRFNEIQIGIDIVSGTTTPVVTQMALIFDDNKVENLIS